MISEIQNKLDIIEKTLSKELTPEEVLFSSGKILLEDLNLISALKDLSNEVTVKELSYAKFVDNCDMVIKTANYLEEVRNKIEYLNFVRMGNKYDFTKLKQMYKERNIASKFPKLNLKRYEELVNNPVLELINFEGKTIKYDPFLVGKVLISINQLIFDEMDVRIVNVGKEGCLAGDTQVQISRSKNSYKYSMKQLHQIWHRYWKNEKIKTKADFYTRSYDGNKIRLHKIKDVIYSGKKKTYTLTLKTGEKIRATDNHKFVSRNGWTRLDALKVGDELLIDTNKPLKRNVGRKVFKFCDPQPNAGFHPYARKGNRVEIHRLIFEAGLNKLDLFEFMDILLNEEEQTKTLSFVDPGVYHVHHIDGNHYNNHLDNLECITKQEHLKRHGKENYSNFSQGIVKFSEIVSIDLYGEEDTYDIECEDPYHNFVANNIVVHNSGKSCFASQLMYYYWWVMKEIGLISYEFEVKKLFFSSVSKLLEVQEAQKEDDYGRIFCLDEGYELNRSNFREEDSRNYKDSMRSDRKMLRVEFVNLPQLGELELAITQTRTNFIFEAVLYNDKLTSTLKKGLIKFYIVPRGDRIYSRYLRRELSAKEVINTLSMILKDKNDSYKGLPDSLLIHQFYFPNVWSFDKSVYDTYIKGENKIRRHKKNESITDYLAYILYKKLPPTKHLGMFDLTIPADLSMYKMFQKFREKIRIRFETNPDLLFKYQKIEEVKKNES